MNIISATCFLAFVAAGVAITAGQRWVPEATKRSLTNLFIAIAMLVSFASGLSQRDMWPFSSWTMMVGLTPPATRTLPTLRIIAVDADGVEREIDYRAWNPLSMEELYSWMNHYFFQTDPASQARVASYLLQLSNHAREQALSESGLPFSNRWLGRLTAPTHLLHPAIWSHGDGVPRRPFVGLRIYRQSWDLEASATAPARNERELVYEYLPQ